MRLFNFFRRESGNGDAGTLSLLRARTAAIRKMSSRNHEENIKELEKIRTSAAEHGFFFEECLLLLDEIQYLIETGLEEGLFESAQERLLELEKVFDLDKDSFKNKVETVYLGNKGKLSRSYSLGLIQSMHRNFNFHFEYMSFCMLNHIASVCGKISLKIAEVCGGLSTTDIMECLFKMAVDYGNMGEVSKAMHYYDEGLNIALTTEDLTYIFIATYRKLSLCMTAAGIDIQANMDLHFREAVQVLIGLCEALEMSPAEVGEFLKDLEEKKLKTAKGKEAALQQFRLDRLNEALPIMNLILALERGDMGTAGLYGAMLSDSEKKVYGGSAGMGADIVSSLYAANYDSVERNEVQEEDSEDDNEEDGWMLGITADYFPEDMPKFQIVALLLVYLRSQLMRGHYQNAEHLYGIAKEITDKVGAHYKGAMIDYERGKCHHARREYVKAERYYKRALAHMEKCPDSEMVSNLRVSIALSYGTLLTEFRPADAVGTLKDGLDGLWKESTHYSRFTVAFHIALAKTYSNISEPEQAEPHCIKALEELLADVTLRVPGMSRENKENYWSHAQKSLAEVISLLRPDSSEEFRTKAYEAVLFAKGFLLASENILKDIIYGEDSLKDLRSLYENVSRYESEKRLWGTSTDDSSNEYMQHFINSMKLSIETEEHIRKYFSSLTANYKEIAAELNDDSIVIDYYDYPTETGRRYIAFTYGKDDAAPEVVLLCQSSDIEEIYSEIPEEKMQSTIYDPASPLSARLRGCLLDRALERLNPNEGSTVYFIPSGEIHKICIEALCLDSESTTGKFRVIRLSHARGLKSARESRNFDGIELYGGLDFGGVDDFEPGEYRGAAEREKGSVTQFLPWEPLPYSGIEVNEVADIWNRNSASPARVYTGTKGTTEQFYRMDSNAPSIIHIATHGFYETRESCGRLPILRDSHRPLDLTGLVMSSGNNGWIYGTRNCYPGIIKASDICSMDLRGCAMVVLSACHSAEGVIHSDGVYGLQRAFKKAGAGTLIMSLWKVRDDIGTFFMKTFYEDLMNGSKDRHTAIEVARKKTKEKYQDPGSWAGFILID